MKTRFFYPIAAAVLLIAAGGNSAAQDVKGGVVKYKQITKYNFDTFYADRARGDANTQAWLAALPKEHEQFKVLYFTENTALYEEDPTAEEAAPDPNVQRALMGMEGRGRGVRGGGSPPTVELEKVFFDFEKNEKIQQVMFMTRNFLVSDSIRSEAWKLTNKMIKVLDYTCLGAEIVKGDTTITAWFTSEIPISTGPEMFFGLPGLILAIEINGETAFIATSVDLTPPEEGVMSKPDKGEKMTQEEFDKTVEEKIKEWLKNRRIIRR